MKNPVGVLARGWRKGATKWYVSTAMVLAGSVTLLLLVSGLFAGMQSETESRISDFYTEDVRVTVVGEGAIPPSNFPDLQQAVAALSSHGGDPIVHLESQGILSRRSFADAAKEDTQINLDAPGSAGSGDSVVTLGALVGIQMEDPASRTRIEEHIVAGKLPDSGTGEGSIPVTMSLDRLDAFLTSKERSELSSWPPPMAEINDLTFELTAAVVQEGRQDVIRRPGHIAAIFDSGVDVLDAFTYVIPIEDARQLLGHEPRAPIANALLVRGGDTSGAHDIAEANGWTHQGSETFTQRYLGQLMDVLRGLSVLMAAFLFLLPAFLVTHGVTRQLETHNREIAVCHAIGIRPRTVRTALSLLVVQVVALAIVVAAVATGVFGAILHGVLPGRRDLPLPMDFHATGSSIVLAVLVTAGSVALALWIAFRSHGRQPLAETLRTF